MQTLASMVLFLSRLAVLPAGSRGVTPPTAETGQRIFNDTCIACHQADGAGIPGAYPSLAGSPVVLGDAAALARWVVLGERPASMPAGRYAAQMPRFGWLAPANAAMLLTYIRSSFGNA